MRATAHLKDLSPANGKQIIVRNLSRILDIRILDIDTESRTITFLYNSVLALEKVKRELLSIGFPVKKFRYQDPQKDKPVLNNIETLTHH